MRLPRVLVLRGAMRSVCRLKVLDDWPIWTSSENMLHVGFAETDITPKLGSQSPGGMQARRLNRVHDPLKAVAMVIKGEETTVALVGYRLAFHHGGNDGAASRAGGARDTRIPAANVLIGASHTHGGGPIASCFESEADPAYMELVAAKVAEAVGSAYRSLHAAELGDGIGHEPSISFNRRFLMRDGRQVTHPGKGQPGYRQTGRARSIPTSAFWRPDRRRASCWDCSSTSPAILPCWEETDLPPIMFTTFERRCGSTTRSRPLPVGFLLGAAGDVTQVDNRRPRP